MALRALTWRDVALPTGRLGQRLGATRVGTRSIGGELTLKPQSSGGVSRMLTVVDGHTKKVPVQRPERHIGSTDGGISNFVRGSVMV